MANKFGKFLLVTAAIGTAVAATYYFKHQKDNKAASDNSEDDDEDFSEDLDTDFSERNYVSLNKDDVSVAAEDTFAVEEASEFSPLSEQLTTEEEVEEFFDDKQ